jgi:hypothetical protein
MGSLRKGERADPTEDLSDATFCSAPDRKLMVMLTGNADHIMSAVLTPWGGLKFQ